MNLTDFSYMSRYLPTRRNVHGVKSASRVNVTADWLEKPHFGLASSPSPHTSP